MNKYKVFSKMRYLVLLTVAFVAGCASNGQEITTIPDTTAPTVSFTSPANGDIAIPVNRKVSVGFSEMMNPATVTTTSFTIRETVSGNNVPGAVTPVGTSATFTPTASLKFSTNYTATIKGGLFGAVKDLAGNRMASDFVFTFSTGAIADIIAPTVSVTSPANTDVAVPVNRKVNVAFSEVMDPASFSAASFTLKETVGGANVPGAITPVGTSATFAPTANLKFSTNYTATIKGGSVAGVKDLANNAMAVDYIFTFTTGAIADTIAPTVSVTSPTDTAVAVPVNRILNVGFSEEMEPATISTASFTLKEFVSNNNIPGTVIRVGTSATFAPLNPLALSTKYAATIKGGNLGGVKDLAGNAMVSDFVFTFTTGAIADIIAPTVSVTSPTGTAVAVPVNRKVNVAFSEVMDPASFSAASFSMKETVGGANVPGAITPVGSSATFAPTANLKFSTNYTATIKGGNVAGVKDLANNAMAVDYVFTFTTGAITDTVAPTVSVTSPTDTAVAVPVNRILNVGFSEEMEPLTISTASFTLKEFVSNNNVPGTVTRVGTSATFAPVNPLALSTKYSATIKGGIVGGVKDLAGNAMVNDFVFTFTTGPTADATAPTLITTNVLDGATGLPVNSSSTATFSEPMDPATLASPATSFTVKETLNSAPVAGVVTYIGNTATFRPNINLKPLTQYTSTISTGAKDLAGNALIAGLRANPWSWTTGPAADVTAPTVTVTNPANLATNVPVNNSINATFNEAMSLDTMTTANITLNETGIIGNVPGTVAYDVQNNIATFSPQNNLKPDTGYTVTVTNGAKDLAGNALVVPAVNGLPTPNPWTFRTAATPVPPAALAINLRGAASFGIAARAGLTSTGVTVVNGDVALHPLAGCIDSTGNAGASQDCLNKTYSSPTGMTVNGSIYWAGDPFDNGGTANSVTNDLNVAWTEGMNKVDTLAGVLLGQLGGPGPVGKIIFPGVYNEANLGFAAGTVATFDAQNNANAIFIIKVGTIGGAGDFTDSGTLLLPTQIKLVNGAQARNIWFVVGRDITIGSGTTWNGNILAGRTATVLDGSTVVGRVLAGAAGAGAITLTGAASPSVTTISVPQ